MKTIKQEKNTNPTSFIPELKADQVKDLQLQCAKNHNLPVYFSDRIKKDVLGPELAIIPAGQYEMGSHSEEFGHSATENPQHYSCITKPFAIGRFTITANDFEHFIADTEWHFRKDLIWSSGRKPVINVRMSDAILYADWLSEQTGYIYRLPTESEWEYAARAGTSTAFHFGDEVTCKEVHFHSLFPYNEAKKKKRWFLPKCSPMATALEVGSKPSNNWGLHEVHGNVWEFTNTPWHDSHFHSNRDGSANDKFLSRAVVTKGGSWFDEAIHARSASRRRRLFDELDTNLGFRLVREL